MYRVKQFFWGLFARVTKDDIDFMDHYLNDYEKALFMMLPRNEKLHSIKVARIVMNEMNKKKQTINKENRAIIIKAALLHDVGKIQSGLNIFSKSILVIGDKLFPDTLKKFVNIKAINAYYNHPEIAISLLPDCDESMKYYILNHHKYDLIGDETLKIIQNADSMS